MQEIFYKTFLKTTDPRTQHYPPGTQEKYNNFVSRNIMMEKGKELKSPKGGEGVRGNRGFPLQELNTALLFHSK